ncbi:MAG TPA: UbiD family decarboxylase, partial [Chloroflexota bacterium]
GEPCPVAISVGHDPLIFLVGSTELPYGVSEYEVAGGIRGEPLEVIEGPLTGLPVPARAEFVIEGECWPGETATEGPFGEWTGYYGSGARGEPVIRVKAIYHREDPIILGAPGLRPPKGIALHSQILRASHILESLRQAGVPGVTGVWCHQAGGGYLFTAVAIKQAYPGHARQAAQVAAFCRGGAYLGRFTVVVDDDIDVADLGQVVWAMSTRCDPAKDIETVERCWSGPLDPIIPPEQKGFNSRAIVDACRPWEWRDRFPEVVDMSPALREAMLAKFGDQLRAKAMRAPARADPAPAATGETHG